MSNVKRWLDFVNESITMYEKALAFIKRQMESDKRSYKGHIPTKYNPGSPWSDRSWLIDEISSFLNKNYSTSYILKLTEPFSKDYTYEELDNILKQYFPSEYEEALSINKE